MTNIYDAIVIGGGHNGLINAAYLARAGRRVLVLERRHLVGGAMYFFNNGDQQPLEAYPTCTPST